MNVLIVYILLEKFNVTTDDNPTSVDLSLSFKEMSILSQGDIGTCLQTKAFCGIKFATNGISHDHILHCSY